MLALLRLALFAVVLLASLSVAGQSTIASGSQEPVRSLSTDPPNVLVLTAYQYGLPIPDSIHRGILAALKENHITVANAFIEHLDLARMSTSEHRAILGTMLRQKLAGKRFDIVIVEGSPVIDFVTNEGKDLFPEAVLLTLITPSTGALINDPRKVIDIRWRVDPAGTLRAALDLFPTTRRVVVVTGALDSILPFIDEAKKALAPWKDKLEIEYTNEMSYEQMMGRIATLPANSLIIYSPYFTDTSGRTFVPAEVVVKVSQTANAPVFGTMEAYLGHGIVGGSLLKTEDLGKQAGKVALDYLDGRLQLPKQKTSFDSPTKMMFDWEELTRWKADTSRLPENSIVINRPQSLWGQHKAEVIATTVLFLIFSVLIARLLILNRKLIRTNAAVSEAEARFRSLTEVSSDFYWESDTEHRISRRGLGSKSNAMPVFQRATQIGERRWEVPYLAPDAAGWEAHRALLDARLPFRDFEISRLGVEGAAHCVSLSGDPVFDAAGVFKGYRGVGTDVTERKSSENALRESEQQLRAIFDGALDGILVADGEGKTFYAANPAICSMLGHTQEEFLDLNVSDIHPPQGLPRVAEHFNRMLRGDLQLAIDMPVMRKDGSVFYADIKAAPIRFGGKDAVLGIFRDVSERLKSEQQLIEAEAQFRGLVEQSIAGTYIVQDGKFAYVNPRYAEIFGYGSADELIGRDVLSIITEKDRDTMTESIRRRMEGEIEAVTYNFAGLRKDGSIIDVGGHGTRATYRGRPAVIGMVQDISEKKRAEEQIQRHIAQLEIAFMSTVQVATTLGEMRDPYTAGHQRRVAEIAAAIGAELGFDARQQEGLRVAGYLHDIGKITIPAEILSKPGRLSAIEFQLIQGHPQSGYEVLKDLEFPWPVAQVALQHHERIDGSGYPQGLKNEAILLEARIMAVADVVEAMSSHRPYRPGLGIEATLSEIERGRGTLYDVEVADACLKLFREKGYVIAV